MRSRKLNFPRARLVALAVGMGVIGSLAMSASAMAGSVGTACQASDGKISGRGSTFQGNALTTVINGYTNDVCGTVALQYTGDPAGSAMVAYNYTAAKNAGARGSGEGAEAMACRTDAFAGTDVPYSETFTPPAPAAQFTQLNFLWTQVPSTTNKWAFFDPFFGADGANGCDTFATPVGTPTVQWTPPYTPAPTAGCTSAGPTTCYPSGTNAASQMMSFPIAIGAAGVGVDFTTGSGTTRTQITGCPTTPTQAQLTASQFSQIMAGEISNWSQLGSTTPFNWTGCNLAITRVVRADVSGTTSAVKTYLKSVDGTRALCGTTGTTTLTWGNLQALNQNANWPGDSADPCVSTVTATTPENGTGSGTCANGAGVVCRVQNTPGAIGYGDLPNWKAVPVNGTVSSVMFVPLPPATGGGANALPGTGAGSGTGIGTGTPNCDTAFSGNQPGAGGALDMVGLDESATTPGSPANTNWGTDAAAGASGVVPGDITNQGIKYPLCTLTYDEVYAGLSTTNGTYLANAIGGLTADQRRTIYTFFRYMLSPDAQGLLASAGYKALPSAWASNERAGFIQGF